MWGETHAPRRGVIDAPSWSRHTTRDCNIHDPCITPNPLRCRRWTRRLRQQCLLQNPRLLHDQAGRFGRSGVLVGLRPHPKFEVGEEKVDVLHSHIHRVAHSARGDETTEWCRSLVEGQQRVRFLVLSPSQSAAGIGQRLSTPRLREPELPKSGLSFHTSVRAAWAVVDLASLQWQQRAAACASVEGGPLPRLTASQTVYQRDEGQHGLVRPPCLHPGDPTTL